MRREIQLAIGGAAGAALVAGVLGYALGAARPGSGPAAAAAPDGAPAAGLRALEAELRERDEHIARLEQQVLARSTPREPALSERDERDTAVPERSAPDPPGPVDPSLGAAAAWLRAHLPERFGALTPEAAAAITELDLRGVELTDADLALLRSLSELRSLSLRGTAVTDLGVAELRSLSRLESLELRGTAVTGQALRDLPTWSLRALHLTDTQVAGEDLFGMPPMAALETLKLNRLAFGDGEVEALARFPGVRHLELDGTSITDAGLARLFELNPGLTRVELRDTAVTAEKAAALRRQHPDCELVLDSGGPLVLYR